MSNLPLGDDLKKLFDDVTNGNGQDTPVRAILVQNDNGILKLVEAVDPEGSDKEDFSPLLGKLFAKEPTKPGYALFRLDSKSPAGLFEWINCAYRPEGARVREKMQYSITQASLFKGLSEQHFLETVYGSTAAEFSFPSKLRNARKHDYQNPQQNTRGKSAAQAAGTDAGGAKRNFEAFNAVSKPQTSVAETLAPFATTPEQAKAAASDEVTQPSTSEDHNERIALNAQSAGSNGGIAKDSEDVAATTESAETSKADHAGGESEANVALAAVTDSTKFSAGDEEATVPTSFKPAIVASSAASERDRDQEATASQPAQSSLPESKFVNPHPPSTSSEQAAPATATKETTEPTSSTAQTTIAPSPKAASTGNSIGVGSGAEGLHTEKERQLAALKADEAQQRSSAVGTGGPRTGFQWHEEVAPALQSLVGKNNNLVILRVDLSNEEVQLAEQPSSVEPDQLADVLSTSQGKRDNEPSYVVYAHPQALDEGSNTNVGVIYVCPLSCTVRQRMLYSTNMIKLCKGVDSIEGLQLLKRAETSDPADLTADELSQVLLLQADNAADQNTATQATFSRPKRPGRK